MDGFDRLVKTPMWKRLKLAKEAVFELEISLTTNGFAPSYAYDARCKLTDMENNLRGYFKAGMDLKEKEIPNANTNKKL